MMHVSQSGRGASPVRDARRRPLAAGAGLLLLAAALGGCGSSSTTAYDLSAARSARAARLSGQIVVAEPTALQAFESERIAVKDAAGTVSVLPDAQWADRLPRLLQARLVQTFENASKSRSVARPGDGVTADAQLATEIRAFQFDARSGEAIVEISAKLVDARGGRILNARLFSSRTPVGSANPGEVTQALDRSLGTVLTEMVRWASTGPQPSPPPPADGALRTGAL